MLNFFGMWKQCLGFHNQVNTNGLLFIIKRPYQCDYRLARKMWSYYGAGLHNDTIYHDEYSKILTVNELLFIIKLTELK